MSTLTLVEFVRANPEALGRALLAAHDDKALRTLVRRLPDHALNGLCAEFLDSIGRSGTDA